MEVYMIEDHVLLVCGLCGYPHKMGITGLPKKQSIESGQFEPKLKAQLA